MFPDRKEPARIEVQPGSLPQEQRTECATEVLISHIIARRVDGFQRLAILH